VTAALLAIACAAWGVAVIDVVAESAGSGGETLSIFGGHVASGLSPAVGIWAIAALSCSAVVAIAFAWHFWRIGRVDREIDSEVNRRWSELSTKAAGMEARNNLLEWRVPILQNNVEELLDKRDELLHELLKISERKRVLKEMVVELEKATGSTDGSVETDSTEIVKVPEAAESRSTKKVAAGSEEKAASSSTQAV
jgi:hypothetical protein